MLVRLAICTRNAVEATEYEYFREINALKFVLIRNSVTQVSRTILLLYQKHNTSVLEYLNNLRSILSTNAIDLIVGDFNINYLDDDNIRPLKLLMDSLNYTQIIQSATFILTGCLLDQAYVKDSILNVIQNSAVSVYYSDHDAAVKLAITFK